MPNNRPEAALHISGAVRIANANDTTPNAVTMANNHRAQLRLAEIFHAKYPRTADVSRFATVFITLESSALGKATKPSQIAAENIKAIAAESQRCATACTTRRGVGSTVSVMLRSNVRVKAATRLGRRP